MRVSMCKRSSLNMCVYLSYYILTTIDTCVCIYDNTTKLIEPSALEVRVYLRNRMSLNNCVCECLSYYIFISADACKCTHVGY